MSLIINFLACYSLLFKQIYGLVILNYYLNLIIRSSSYVRISFKSFETVNVKTLNFYRFDQLNSFLFHSMAEYQIYTEYSVHPYNIMLELIGMLLKTRTFIICKRKLLTICHAYCSTMKFMAKSKTF